jgi:hypothetical protein
LLIACVYSRRVIPQTRYGRPARRAEGSAFAAGSERRPLKLVIDDSSLSPDDVALLTSFGEYPEVELWRTAADAFPRFEIDERFDTPFRMGGALSILTRAEGGRAGVFGVYGTERLRRRAEEVAAAEGIPAEEVFRALVFAAASDESDADAFVSRRSFLLEDDGPRSPIVVDPAQALALVGLAMRVNGNHAIGADLIDLQLKGSTFHFLLARDLLRAGWRWFSGCVASGHATGDDSIVYLGQTAHERFQRVLQLRDRLHALAKQEPTRSRGDEVLFQLETLLLFLSAAFDATARVAHIVYLGGDYEEAGWRRPSWQKKLEPVAPQLAAVAADGTAGAALLQIIGALRNTIHGEALRTTENREPSGLTAQLIELPDREAVKIRERLAVLGEDADDWGLRVNHGRHALAPDHFVEALLPRSVAVLNELMEETKTELLPGVDVPDLRGPPGDMPNSRWWDDMFSWEIRQRVRLLGGI